MSGKSVLFSAFAAVILVLALGQGLLLNYLSDDIQQEIRSQSLHLSKEIALFATDSIDFSNAGFSFTTQQSDSEQPNIPSQQQFQLEFKIDDQQPNQTQVTPQVHGQVNKVIKQVDDFTNQVVIYKTDEPKAFSSNDNDANNHTVLTQDSVSLVQVVKQHLDTIDIHKLEQGANNQQVWVFESELDGAAPLRKTINIQDRSGALLDKLKQQALLVLLCGSILGLGLAYWISHKFNQPLQKLSLGYDQISQGKFEHHLKPEGVAEMRQVMQGFNQMTDRLAEFTAQERQLQEKSHLAEIGEVTRGIAHALRNPLHTIGLALERIMSGKPEQAALEQGIRNKLKHMDKTIQSLLTLTATGVDRQQQVQVKGLLQDIILEIKMAASKPIQFDYDIAPELAIRGSETELRSILHTLIINAVEASSDNQTIKIQTQSTSNQLSIQVLDQGNGIADSIQHQLFEPHITTKAEGTGMGLYIAKRLANLFYGGDIQLENRQPTGCIATFSINTLEA